MQSQEWCTIESDPAVFTELIQSLGVRNVEVEEIYDMSEENMQAKHTYGLIFLFRWTTKGEKRECLKVYDSDLFFANQVIQNACATQAIVSVLLNSPDIEIGKELTNYKEFAMGLDPRDRGLVLGNSDVIRNSHNSFARPEPFIFSGKKKAKEGDAIYHFIAYVPFKGRVYELDGLQEGPILLGEVSDQVEWIQIAREAIMKRIAMYQETEITFTLLSIIKSHDAVADEELKAVQNELLTHYLKLQKLGALVGDDFKELQVLQKMSLNPMEVELSDDVEVLKAKIDYLRGDIERLRVFKEQQKQKIQNYHLENTRRKHNYIPMILEILKMAAQKGQLDQLIEDAKKKQQSKQSSI